MPHWSFASILSLILIFAAASTPASAATDDRTVLTSAKNFFQDPPILGASLSPNGRFVAIRATSESGRMMLTTLDVATMKLSTTVSYANVDVLNASWLNDKRLFFVLANVGQGAVSGGPGMYAVDRSGGTVTLVSDSIQYRRSFSDNPEFEFSSRLNNNGELRSGIDPDEMFVRGIYDGQIALYRLNTRTAVMTHIPGPFDIKNWRNSTYARTGRDTELEGKDRALSWLVDQSGEVRVAEVLKSGRRVVFLKDPSTNWREIATFNPATEDGFEPLLYLNEKLYVRAYNGRDTKAIFRYDLVKNAIEAEPIVIAPGFDVDGDFIIANNKILGFRLLAESEVTVWYDEVMKKVQKEIDDILPNTFNTIARGEKSETPFVLIDAHSDSDPHTFYLFNSDTKKLTQLGVSSPGLTSEQIVTRSLVHYKARDGLTIPAFVTLPNVAVKRQLPMVVLIGAKPWQRSASSSWNPEVPFLAGRGYVVLQPEARGTAGYGARYFKAGWQQWGRAMQDDIADGVRWAISEGIADPKRICIAGTMYGGYAALMGLIKDPALFKCGISWTGIADLSLMFENHWKDFPNAPDANRMATLVGENDAAKLKNISPLENASLIKQPLLLAHGEEDQMVPFSHALQLYKAIKAGNSNVEWVTYSQAGRESPLAVNRIDFWVRVEKFLSSQIGAKNTTNDAGR